MAERLAPSEAAWTTYGYEHVQRYTHALPYTAGKSVIDVGCGVGYGTFILANNGASKVLGVDQSKDVIGSAAQKYPHPNASFEQADAEELTERLGRFDVVISFENIEHLQNPLKFIDGAARLLNERGILLVSAPNTLQFLKAEKPLLNEYHLSEPTYDELRTWVSTRFSIEQEWEQSPVDYGIERSQIGSLFLIRLERKIRRMLGIWQNGAGSSDLLWKTTEILPLLPERRNRCQQFLFVCRKKPIV